MTAWPQAPVCVCVCVDLGDTQTAQYLADPSNCLCCLSAADFELAHQDIKTAIGHHSQTPELTKLSNQASGLAHILPSLSVSGSPLYLTPPPMLSNQRLAK